MRKHDGSTMRESLYAQVTERADRNERVKAAMDQGSQNNEAPGNPFVMSNPAAMRRATRKTSMMRLREASAADLAPNVVDEVRTGTYHSLFHPVQMITRGEMTQH
ncbi:hypothetical protein BC567DRAFT_212985 [Phyllosticta citribraziliensis]